jgi:hypothetical protein
MTKDLALLVGPDQKWLTTMGYPGSGRVKGRREPEQGADIGAFAKPLKPADLPVMHERPPPHREGVAIIAAGRRAS